MCVYTCTVCVTSIQDLDLFIYGTNLYPVYHIIDPYYLFVSFLALYSKNLLFYGVGVSYLHFFHQHILTQSSDIFEGGSQGHGLVRYA